MIHKPILFLKEKLSDKNFFLISTVLVGITSGLAAVILKYCVHQIGLFVTYTRNKDNIFIYAFLPFIGLIITTFIVKYFLKNKIRKGSAEIVYRIVKKSSYVSPREMYAHLVTSAFTVGLGGSLGLESPMVSTGSAIGSNYGRVYDLGYKDRTVLLGCGAAAGIAAAFNSPIAGVLFAIEVLLTNAATSLIPLIISAACGALVSKIILKEGVTLSFSLQQAFNYRNLFYYVLLGITCGLVSLTYTRVLHFIESKFTLIKKSFLKILIGGLVLFGIIITFPSLFGEGYESIRMLESQNTNVLIEGSVIQEILGADHNFLFFLAALIIFKMVAAATTLGSGGNGGSFAPSLVIGAYVGFLFASVIRAFGFSDLPVSNFTLVAMAGILSGIFYAPLTAIFLIAEITGGYSLMIPLMIVSSLSLLVMHFFEPVSMESKKLAGMLHSTIETKDKLLLSRLDLSDLVESNFSVVRSDEKFSELIKIVARSSRNIYPVVDEKNKLVGIVSLDRIRNIMFDREKYEVVTVAELMEMPAAVIDPSENLHDVLLKFDVTSQWNLPVVEDNVYIGFLSKSSILSKYRKGLMESA